VLVSCNVVSCPAFVSVRVRLESKHMATPVACVAPRKRGEP
jgi:hypothetical protein